MLQRQNLPKPCLCSVQLLRIDCWNRVPKRLHFERSTIEMFSVSHNGIGFFFCSILLKTVRYVPSIEEPFNHISHLNFIDLCSMDKFSL